MKRITFIAFSLLAGLALLSSCKKDQIPAAPEGAVELDPAGQTPTFYSSALTYVITSNCDWSISVDEGSDLTIDPLEGVAGTSNISVILPDNTTNDVLKSSFTVVFRNSADVVCNYVIDIEQPRPSVEIGGMSYPVARLADGKWWMTENLRYCPDGKTVSKDLSDIANGVWYPTTTDGTTMSFDESATEVVEKGYLYTPEVAFGTAVTADNYDKLAKVQGICPEGWHIPDFDDWFALVGHCSNSKEIPDDTAAPYYDAALSGFGSIAKAAADGMPFPITGYVNVANASSATGILVGHIGTAGARTMNLGYVLSSSSYKLTPNTDGSVKNIQLYSLMTNANSGTLNLAYLNYRSGVSVRCVKD